MFGFKKSQAYVDEVNKQKVSMKDSALKSMARSDAQAAALREAKRERFASLSSVDKFKEVSFGAAKATKAFSEKLGQVGRKVESKFSKSNNVFKGDKSAQKVVGSVERSSYMSSLKDGKI